MLFSKNKKEKLQHAVEPHLDLLGKRIKDRVTGIEGVATSVSFDLYGCVQVVLTPAVQDDNEIKSGVWMDVNRIEILDHERVMEPPDYLNDNTPITRGEKGAAPKPII